MKKQTAVIAVFIFNFLSVIASVEADQIVWGEGYDKTLGLPLSQNLNTISDSLDKNINKALESYDSLINEYTNKIVELTKNEWTQEDQNEIAELTIMIDCAVKSKMETIYYFEMQKISQNYTLIDINEQINSLNQKIKGNQNYLADINGKLKTLNDKIRRNPDFRVQYYLNTYPKDDLFNNLKQIQEAEERIKDLEFRKNAFEKIVAEKSVIKAIKQNPSLLNKKSLGAVLFLLASSSPLFALKLFLSLLVTGGGAGIAFMTAEAEQFRYLGVLLTLVATPNVISIMRA